MTLEDLVGEHELSGVDSGVLRVNKAYTANRLLFILDGVAYQAIEDEEDGYRSSMREISQVPLDEVANRFSPVRVVGVYEKAPYDDLDGILKLIDCRTGRVVLEVGTDYTDIYYPSFVANFVPQAMALNSPSGDCREV